MPDDIRILDDPEKIKLAIDPTRRKILELLRLNDLTVSQMASTLGKDQSTIYRHVEKLLKAEFIEQTGERKEHHIPEKVYGRTARIFLFAPSVDALSEEEVIVRHRKEVHHKTFGQMKKMGYTPTEKTEEASNELFDEINKVVQARLKGLGPDADMDFESLRRLRTAIIIIEMQKNHEIEKLARKYADSFV